MRRLVAYNFLTLNGFYKGLNDDISWHVHGSEEADFAVDMLQFKSTLIFGRVTYEMMAGYWPTPMAAQNDPKVAEGMNSAEKIVFSNTLKKADWENTTVISGDIFEAIKRLKDTSGSDMTILGSGSIISQFADKGLIDELQIMIDPVAIGEGTPILHGIKNKLNFNLKDSKIFKNGIVLLSYEPK